MSNLDSETAAVARRLGQNVLRHRQRLGLSHAELAARTDIRPSEVTKIEQGGQLPHAHILLMLANALEVTVDDIVDGIAWRPSDGTEGHFEIAEP